MKLMPALPESVFDVFYLVFAAVCGISLLRGARGRRYVTLFGVITLVLCGGDAFHLVPRVLNYWVKGDFTAALGIGKLVTSVTMTVFYLLLEYARREKYGITGQKGALCAAWVLSAVRIALCAFPQNGWIVASPSLAWGIYRNIPFVILGVLTVILWAKSAKADRPLKYMWLAVTLSFAFYIPVVLFAHTVPLTGMLMLPKTVMYMWIMVMFKKSAKT